MFAEIIIYTKAPLGLLTYQIPPELANTIKIGQIVEVSVRGKKTLGMVFKFRKDKGEILVIKNIVKIVDPNPLPPVYINLIQWIADYYCVSLSESLTSVMPEPPKKIQKSINNEIISNKSDQKQNYLIIGSQANRWENYYKIIAKAKSNNCQTIVCFSKMEDANDFLSHLPGNINYGLYLSNLGKSDKYKVYTNSKTTNYDLICGVRSVIFLPMPNLKTIIIDEPSSIAHHSDQKPYLTTSRIAEWLGKNRNLNVVSGSLSPNSRDWLSYRQNKSKLIKAGGINPNSNLQIIDNSKSRDILNPQLIGELGKYLNKHKKIFLFLPKSYYSKVLKCLDCQELVSCKKCGKVMDSGSNELNCQSCNFQSKSPNQCPGCGGKNLTERGFSLSQLNNELSKLFGSQAMQIKIGGMLELEYIKENSFDLIGIINLDFMFKILAFNQEEKTYALLTRIIQAGKKVILQTIEPQSPILQNFISHNTSNLYDSILSQRKKYNFPPFGNIAEITIGEIDKEKSLSEIEALISKIGNDFECYGPYEKPNFRKNNFFYYQLTVKYSNIEQKKKLISNLNKKYFFEIEE